MLMKCKPCNIVLKGYVNIFTPQQRQFLLAFGTCRMLILDPDKKSKPEFTTTDTTTLPVVRNVSGTHLINEIWISCRHDHHWDINQTPGQISERSLPAWL